MNNLFKYIEDNQYPAPKKIQEIIDKGIDINQRNKDGLTALMFTCLKKQEKVALLLIKNGANIHEVNRHKHGRVALYQNALIYASINGMSEVVSLLIENGADVNYKDKNLYTALMYASKERLTKTVRILIASGADLNCQSKSGETALLIATRNALPKTVKELIDAGADISIQNSKKRTAYMLAEKYYQRNNGYADEGKELYGDIINLIAEKEGKPLIEVKRKKTDMETIQEYIEQGLNLNQQMDEGYTVLMQLCAKCRGCGDSPCGKYNFTKGECSNSPEAVNLLIEQKVNLNAQNSMGDTALMIACRYNQIHIV